MAPCRDLEIANLVDISYCEPGRPGPELFLPGGATENRTTRPILGSTDRCGTAVPSGVFVSVTTRDTTSRGSSDFRQLPSPRSGGKRLSRTASPRPHAGLSIESRLRARWPGRTRAAGTRSHTRAARCRPGYTAG